MACARSAVLVTNKRAREQPSPKKPLVVSLHGPPGVGKTYFHKLLAEAVYNMTGGPGRAAACESGSVRSQGRAHARTAG